jgi:hypothetical protein
LKFDDAAFKKLEGLNVGITDFLPEITAGNNDNIIIAQNND